MAQIKKDTSLRKAILQAAITGQLISDIGGESLPLAAAGKPSSATPSPRGYAPKTPNEFASFENQNSVSERSERPTLPETGKQLLDRIIEERNKKLLAEWEEALKKNPKAKKPAPIVASEIDEDEIPFEIPENWCWCRLGDIIDLLSGRDLEPSAYNSISKGIPYMTGASNFNNEELIVNRWTDKPATISNLGDLLITCKGTIGELAFNHVGDVHIARQIMAIRKTEYINLKFLKFFLMSRIDEIQKHAKSMIPGISREDMLGFEFPLPPLSIQNAIVAKLEQVLPLVDAYENALLQKEELKNALPDKVKKAILQEAITGQLTENWRKSATIKESGKQLLERIIEERNAQALADWEEALKKNVGGKATLPSFASKTRAKKPVPVVASEIDEEEIPFEVPESWCWCRWGELSELIQYGYNAPAKESGRIKMVRITDIQNGKVQWNTVPFCEISDTDIQVYQLRKNDILFARTGGTVGKSFLVDEEPENAVFAGYLIRTQYDDKKLNPKYMKMFMESQIYWDQLKNGTIATAQPNCNGQTLSKMILPLPPLEEQQEIVKKVEELLELCK